jgi:hypothetical protein
MDEFEPESDGRRFAGPGGTSGGVLEFVVGFGLFALGAYFVTSRVTVFSGFPQWFGDYTFGITLVPFLIGLGMLFFDGRSILGWVLAGAGLLAILGGVLMSLRITFEPTSLFHTLVIFGLLAAGAGVMARALRSH